MADNETLARALYEAWNNRDWQATMDAVAPGGTITVMGTGDTFEGAGDSVVVEFTGHGITPDR